jgi:hypothetical protein
MGPYYAHSLCAASSNGLVQWCWPRPRSCRRWCVIRSPAGCFRKFLRNRFLITRDRRSHRHTCVIAALEPDIRLQCIPLAPIERTAWASAAVLWLKRQQAVCRGSRQYAPVVPHLGPWPCRRCPPAGSSIDDLQPSDLLDHASSTIIAEGVAARDLL